jgi:beta-glucosidase
VRRQDTPVELEKVEVTLRERLASLSLEQKVRLLTGADFWSLHPEPAIGPRRLVLWDGPAGVRERSASPMSAACRPAGSAPR